MNVLLSTMNFAAGGVSKAFLEVIAICEKNNINYDVVVESSDGPYLKYINSDKIHVINVKSKFFVKLLNDYKHHNKNTTLLNRCLIVIAKILKRIVPINIIYLLASLCSEPINKNYDCVIDFHGYGVFSTYYLAFNYSGCKKYSWIHDEKALFIKYNKLALKQFDILVCVSNSCKAKVKAVFPTFNNVEVVHNIINKDELIKQSNEYEIVFQKTTLLSIGRLEYQKGFDIIPLVARKLLNDDCDFQWLIIGSGSLKEELEELIYNNGVSNTVKLLGFIENPMPYMKACDIYVQTSLHEGYPTTVSEALVMNKIIVGTDLPSMYEATQSINNHLLVNRDVESLYGIISKLIRDQKLYNQLSQVLKNSKIRCYEDEFVELLTQKSRPLKI